MRYLITMQDGSQWLTNFERAGAIQRADGCEMPQGTILAREVGEHAVLRVFLNLMHAVSIIDLEHA